MVNLRKAALWAAGGILAVVVIVLLVWPGIAGALTMGALLVAAALGAWGIAGNRERFTK